MEINSLAPLKFPRGDDRGKTSDEQDHCSLCSAKTSKPVGLLETAKKGIDLSFTYVNDRKICVYTFPAFFCKSVRSRDGRAFFSFPNKYLFFSS